MVVDNPPFSLLAQITRFYVDRGIPFFLFSPTLTAFSANLPGVCYVLASAGITYENGAVVETSFRTNLEKGIVIRTAPELTAIVEQANKENTQSDEKLLKYAYPINLITASRVADWGKAGVMFSVPDGEAVRVSALDAQKEKKLGIYGGGFLLSTAQAAKAAKAAKAAQAAQAAKAAKAAQAAQAAQAAKAAKAAQAAQAAKAAKAAKAAQAAQAAGIPPEQINENGEIVWSLSERELEIIAELDRRSGK